MPDLRLVFVYLFVQSQPLVGILEERLIPLSVLRLLQPPSFSLDLIPSLPRLSQYLLPLKPGIHTRFEAPAPPITANGHSRSKIPQIGRTRASSHYQTVVNQTCHFPSPPFFLYLSLLTFVRLDSSVRTMSSNQDDHDTAPPVAVADSGDHGEGGKVKMIVSLVKKCLGVKDIASMWVWRRFGTTVVDHF
jgi:hypothetical protein